MKSSPLRSSRFLLLVSIVAAVLAAVAFLSYLQNLRSRVAENGRLIKLVVAARDLEAGEVLGPSSLSLVDFPDRYLAPGMFTDPAAVSGGRLLHATGAGEPLLASALLPHGSSLGTESLDGGFRAYPLPASSIAFPVDGLVQGVRVDILAVNEEGARTLLENVEVLCVLGRLAIYPEDGEGLSSPGGSEGECILLQVTAEEACRLAAAQESGKLEVLLRPHHLSGGGDTALSSD
jgi:Flp pilus assembly protein CpaB